MTMTEPNMTVRAIVAGEVRAAITKGGLTPTDIGRITKRGQQYWSRRTTGVTPFDVDDFAVLSEILGVPMTTFLPPVTVGDPESPLSDLNRRPSLYKSGALPLS